MQCSNNIKQLGLAVHNCNDTYNKLPPMYCDTGGYLSSFNPSGTGSLFYWLLPFIEQQNLYNLGGGNAYIGAAPSNGITNTLVKTYECPSDPTYGTYVGVLYPTNPWALGCYGGNYQVFGNPDAGDYPANNFSGERNISSLFTDGTSNTIMFAEKYALCGAYGSLWSHGSWESNYMAIFAYGNRAGTQGYQCTENWGPPGSVGAASKFQMAPNPYLSACLSPLSQTAGTSAA